MPLQLLMRRMLEPLASHKEGSHGCCWGRDNSGPSRETGVGTGWKSLSGPRQVDIEIARCKDRFGMKLWMQGLTYAAHEVTSVVGADARVPELSRKEHTPYDLVESYLTEPYAPYLPRYVQYAAQGYYPNVCQSHQARYLRRRPRIVYLDTTSFLVRPQATLNIPSE